MWDFLPCHEKPFNIIILYSPCYYTGLWFRSYMIICIMMRWMFSIIAHRIRGLSCSVRNVRWIQNARLIHFNRGVFAVFKRDYMIEFTGKNRRHNRGQTMCSSYVHRVVYRAYKSCRIIAALQCISYVIICNIIYLEL